MVLKGKTGQLVLYYKTKLMVTTNNDKLKKGLIETRTKTQAETRPIKARHEY